MRSPYREPCPPPKPEPPRRVTWIDDKTTLACANVFNACVLLAFELLVVAYLIPWNR
jgi:hypothetical protein